MTQKTNALLLSLALAFASGAKASLEVLPIRIDAKIVASKSVKVKPTPSVSTQPSQQPATKGAPKDEKIQSKQLAIRLSSVVKNSAGDFEMKCTFYVRNNKNKDVSPGPVQTIPVDFCGDDVNLTTETQTFGGDKSGTEYAGWGIVVYDKEQKIVGKCYSAPYLDPDNAKK